MGLGMPKAAAYDQARKEFYEHRHREDVERMVAKEEALHVGAYFGKSALEIGMELEDKAFEDWKEWATKEIAAQKQAAGASLTSADNDDAELGSEDPDLEPALNEVERSVSAHKRGQDARGGSAVHP